MPALNLTFSDTEMAALRAAAARANVSLKVFAHNAVTDALQDHRRRVQEAAALVAQHSAELNRRLA